MIDGIIQALKNHSALRDKDVLLLTELDHGMARSGNRFVAREIAQALNLNYAFVPVLYPLCKREAASRQRWTVRTRCQSTAWRCSLRTRCENAHASRCQTARTRCGAKRNG
jgi:hypothetical protein